MAYTAHSSSQCSNFFTHKDKALVLVKLVQVSEAGISHLLFIS